VIARRDLGRGSDGIGVLADQLRDRHCQITDQWRVYEITKINNTDNVVTVDEGIQSTDIVMDELRALLPQPWEHMGIEVR